MPSEITGRFHAHITVRGDKEIFPPHGWKTTIIVLSRDNRHQKDVMVTRHFVVGTEKTPSTESIDEEMGKATWNLIRQGATFLRAKLEHESLPTFLPSTIHYREAHIKIKVPHDVRLQTIPGYVQSRNPMSQTDTYDVVFLNARYYEGTIAEVDARIDQSAIEIQALNPNCMVLEVKKETTVYDTNLNLDKWWA